MSAEDLEAEAIPRSDSDARVTRGSSETGFTDFKDENGFPTIPRVGRIRESYSSAEVKRPKK